MRRLLGFAAGALVLIAGGWWGLRAVNVEEGDWVNAVRDDLVLGVEVTGTLKAVDTKLVGPPQLRDLWDFKIAHMAPEGDEVEAGAPVLIFDASELEQGLQREIAERDAARTRIDKAEKELSIQAQQDELRLAEAEAKLRKAELKAASPEELAAARDLELLALDLELARKEVDYLTAKLRSAARSAEARLGTLRDQYQRAERRVEQSQRDIAQMTVVAERAATVVYVTDGRGEKMKVGDSCWKGASVIELPDLSRMKALGMVHEADAGRVSEGQRVTFRLDAHPEVEFTGHVASIWRTVQRESWRSPKKVMRLEIELDETDTRRMRPGMRFRGKVEIDRVPDALLVDAEAVFLGRDGPVVYRRSLTGHDVVPVELGERSESRVEVLRGLKEGDAVSLRDLVEPGGRT